MRARVDRPSLTSLPDRELLRHSQVLPLSTWMPNHFAKHVTSMRLHTFHVYSHVEGKQCRTWCFLPPSLAAFTLQLRQLSLRMLPRYLRPTPTTSSFWTRMVFRRLPSRLSATRPKLSALAIPFD